MKNKEKLTNKKINSSILAIIILVLLLVCAFVLFFEINDYRNVKTETNKFYYYFASQRIDLESVITLNSDERILTFDSGDYLLTSTPIYYSNAKAMILNDNMEIVIPYRRAPMFKLGKLSKVFYKSNYIYVNSEVGKGRIYDCFLYDGNNTYVFLENTSVFVDGIRYDLTPLSFVEATNAYVEIYDYKNDKYTYIESHEKNVEAYTDEYSINLSSDSFIYNDIYYLLIKNIDGLDPYKF